jgi:hypothetical protein
MYVNHGPLTNKKRVLAATVNFWRTNKKRRPPIYLYKFLIFVKFTAELLPPYNVLYIRDQQLIVNRFRSH